MLRKKAGKDVFVNSEYSRIEESTVYPYLANKKIDFTKDFTTDFADEMQMVNTFIIMTLSACINQATNNWLMLSSHNDSPLDLRTLVTVCYTYTDNNTLLTRN